MIILSIDPGETTGLVLFKYEPSSVIVVGSDSRACSISKFTIYLYDFLQRSQIENVVVEDYRIYQGKANMHTGRRLYTAELIGAIRAVCALLDHPVTTLPASKKGRWPDARLRAKLPDHGVTGIHAVDALKLGLAFIEGEMRWVP